MCMYVCIHIVYMYVFICVCICIYIYIYIFYVCVKLGFVFSLFGSISVFVDGFTTDKEGRLVNASSAL